MIDKKEPKVSVQKQCELLAVPRSSFYRKPVPETPFNLLLMKEIDIQYMNTPYAGSRTMVAYLKRKGYNVNRKRVQRLMRQMGLECLYPKPKTRHRIEGEKKFPYLLKEGTVNASNDAWGTDITYIPLNAGFVYLVAVLDLYSRFVLSWRLSNSLDSDFCIEAMEAAFEIGQPTIMNSDQGTQFTCKRYIELLKSKKVEISMSGKGRCWDNIFVERFWRSLKYEEVYLKSYDAWEDASQSIGEYIQNYNQRRVHSALGYATPMEIYHPKEEVHLKKVGCC